MGVIHVMIRVVDLAMDFWQLFETPTGQSVNVLLICTIPSNLCDFMRNDCLTMSVATITIMRYGASLFMWFDKSTRRRF
jgi:hypothetical protein